MRMEIEGIQPQTNWVTDFDWSSPDFQDYTSGRLTTDLAKYLAEKAPNWGYSDKSTSLKFKQFGRYIEALRKAAKLTRPELAKRAGLNPVAVPLLELGALERQELTPEVVERVADVFGIPQHQLAINPTDTEPPVRY